MVISLRGESMLGSASTSKTSVDGARRVSRWQTEKRYFKNWTLDARTSRHKFLSAWPHDIRRNSSAKLRDCDLSSSIIVAKADRTQLFLMISIAITVTHIIQASATQLSDSPAKGACPKTISQTIEPMVVSQNQQFKQDKTFRLGTRPDISCPDTLRLMFRAFETDFVIDLVKNKRLISDRYFKLSSERHKTRQPDSDRTGSMNSNFNEHDDDIDFQKNHMFLNLHNFTSNDDHCHYQGLLKGCQASHGLAALSLVGPSRNVMNGYLHDCHLKRNYFFHSSNNHSPSTVISNFSHPCHKHNLEETKWPIYENPSRSKRSLLTSEKTSLNGVIAPGVPVKHEPFRSNSSSLYVELLIVHDHDQYIVYKKNDTTIAERDMQIVNLMNAFYRQLNIFVSLVGVVVWTERDQIELTDDGDKTLTNFLKYRYEKLLPRYHHDNAQLITSTSFNGSVVGKALKGPICTHEHSGGVNTDHSHNPAIVAVTLSHELGHNFGMEHDEEEKNCRCPDEKCIMSSSSSTVHPKLWSSCSIEHLEESKRHGLLGCLENVPELISGPNCGNGFVEDGEDCDIGEPIPVYGSSKRNKVAASKCRPGQDCELQSAVSNNPCCDRRTCKFVANATCAQGPCCDLTSCSVFNASEARICRARRGECDFEETCDGSSEYCPPDVHYHDGIECGPGALPAGPNDNYGLFEGNPATSPNHNRSRSYCFSGHCASHETQCRLLWGPTSSTSRDLCYEQNVHGNTSGNCGYNRRDKTFEACEPEDAYCGMLHCVHSQPIAADRKTGKLSYGFESASILTVSYFIMSNMAKIYCNGAIVDAGLAVRDPGLVPNGAFCGDNKMCVNQKCLPLHEVLEKNWCPSDCNGNGICDNLGVCHCNDGSIGTSCYLFFGPNFHLSLLLYMIMFFVPMAALILFAANHYRKQIELWWFLHNRKIQLGKQGRTATAKQKRTLAKELGPRDHITISDPIPLNQRHGGFIAVGTNAHSASQPQSSVYDPFVDPWNETNCGLSLDVGAKSAGFKLEPIGSARPVANYTATGAADSAPQHQQQHQGPSRPVRVAPPPPSLAPQAHRPA